EFSSSRAATHELMRPNSFRLRDAEGAIRRLGLHRPVPPAVEVPPMGGGGQVESRAPCSERQHEKPHGFVFLKAAHDFFALLHLGLAVENQAGAPEDRSEETGERR